MVIAAFEHLMEVHLGDALGRLFGVVIIIDINHQTAQQLTHLASHLNLQLIQLAFPQILRDVVVGQERHALLLQPIPDAQTHRQGGNIGSAATVAEATGKGGCHGGEGKRRRLGPGQGVSCTDACRMGGRPGLDSR